MNLLKDVFCKSKFLFYVLFPLTSALATIFYFTFGHPSLEFVTVLIILVVAFILVFVISKVYESCKSNEKDIENFTGRPLYNDSVIASWTNLSTGAIPSGFSRSSTLEASSQIGSTVSTISYPRLSTRPTSRSLGGYDNNLRVSLPPSPPPPSTTTFPSTFSTAPRVSTTSTILNPRGSNGSSATAHSQSYQTMSRESSTATRLVNPSVTSSTASSTFYPMMSSRQPAIRRIGSVHDGGSLDPPPCYEDQRPETPPPSYDEAFKRIS